MERIIINGFFAKGNCGDEAILQTWFDKLSHKYRIVAAIDSDLINCNFEYRDYKLYNEIDIIQNRRVDIFCREDIKAYIIGGGGLGLGFGVEQWLHSLLRNKKRFYLGTIVHDEFTDGNELFREINKKFFESFDMISVRDKISKENLMNHFDLSSFNFPDIAFALEKEIVDIPENKYITVTIRDNHINDINSITQWLNKIQSFAESHNYEIVYLPFDKTDERLMTDLGLKPYHEKIYWEPKKVKYIISQSEMVFSLGRYHPLVFAISCEKTCYYINCQVQDGQWRYNNSNKDKSYFLLNDNDLIQHYLTNSELGIDFQVNSDFKQVGQRLNLDINNFFDLLISKIES